jgi:hypothetical protein
VLRTVADPISGSVAKIRQTDVYNKLVKSFTWNATDAPDGMDRPRTSGGGGGGGGEMRIVPGKCDYAPGVRRS